MDNTSDADGQTILAVAVRYGKIENVRLLVQAGAIPQQEDITLAIEENKYSR